MLSVSPDKRFGDGVPNAGSGGFGGPSPATSGFGGGGTAGAGSRPPGPPAGFRGPLGPVPGGPASPGGPVDLSSGPVNAPVVWLMVAALLEVAGLVLALLSDLRPALSLLGWALGGFGAIGVLAWFTVEDSRRRTDPWYSAAAGPARVRAVLMGTAVLVVALNSYRFADWASRH